MSRSFIFRDIFEILHYKITKMSLIIKDCLSLVPLNQRGANRPRNRALYPIYKVNFIIIQ
jgi:hypothetical protein